jgi:hypothetical protein
MRSQGLYDMTSGFCIVEYQIALPLLLECYKMRWKHRDGTNKTSNESTTIQGWYKKKKPRDSKENPSAIRLSPQQLLLSIQIPSQKACLPPWGAQFQCYTKWQEFFCLSCLPEVVEWMKLQVALLWCRTLRNSYMQESKKLTRMTRVSS